MPERYRQIAARIPERCVGCPTIAYFGGQAEEYELRAEVAGMHHNMIDSIIDYTMDAVERDGIVRQAALKSEMTERQAGRYLDVFDNVVSLAEYCPGLGRGRMPNETFVSSIVSIAMRSTFCRGSIEYDLIMPKQS